MKILIIGGTGQLGSALVKDAKFLNYEVIAPSKIEFNINNKLEFLDLLRYHSPDVVINTVAFSDTILCEKRRIEAFTYNCCAVSDMANICDKFNTQFVTFSTDYVFDGRKGTLYFETDRPNPLNIYGISKLAGEYASLIYDTTIVIRTSTLYGLNNSKNGKINFIDKIIEDSKMYDKVEVACNKFISSTNAEDLSKATLQLILNPKREKRIYHLINEGYCSVFNLAKETLDILNISTELIPTVHKEYDGRIRRPLFSALKNTNAKNIGIILPHWKDTLRDYLNKRVKEKHE